jgi:eukaryotic-like serine/threonine-protein kinase
MVGLTVLHYKVLEKLGEGGMGVVYRAHDLDLDRDVALKFLPQHLLDDDAEEARLLQEAKAAALLNHPNICGVHSLGEYEGRRFIDMEFVDGETLGARIRRSPLSSRDALAYAIQSGDALQEAHSKGIIHRDVKADNVMVNSRNQVKVMDFGLAKLKGSLKLAQSSTTAGTMAYMSPEQIQGQEADARSDIFSLGVLLFQMLAGQLPFRGDHEAAVMYSILNEEPQALEAVRPGLPDNLSQIIARALRKNPAERYQSAGDMVSDLQKSLGAITPAALAAGKIKPSATLVLGGKKWMRLILLIALTLVIILGAAYFLSTRSSQSYDAIAVLPFTNVGGNPSVEYLTDGFTENLINSLSLLPDIKLMSRSSVFRFKGKEVAPEDAGKELGVNAVLTGRLAQRGQSLSVSVELMDVRDHSHIWGDQYERRADQIQDIQKEIVQQVARRLRLSFTEDQKMQLSKNSTENAEAYQLYLKGRFFLNKRTKEGFERAMGFFRQAIEQAPSYAPAYAGLANTYLLQAAYDYRPAKESANLARAAAQQALQLDERSAEAHTVLAALPGFDWAQYEREFLRALELNPNYTYAQHWYGEYLTQVGRVDEAMIHLHKAVELDPLAPIHYVSLAAALITQHRDEEALAQLRTCLDIDPQFPAAHARMAHLLLRMGHPDLAIQEIDRAILFSDSGAEYVARRGLILGRMGKKAEAEKVLRQISNLSKKEFVPFSLLALPYIGLGRKDAAFQLLQRACDELETAMLDLNVDLVFESLRDDPRFAQLLHKIGLQ